MNQTYLHSFNVDLLSSQANYGNSDGNNSKDEGLSTGAIIGIVAGGVVILGLGGWLLLRK